MLLTWGPSISFFPHFRHKTASLFLCATDLIFSCTSSPIRFLNLRRLLDLASVLATPRAQLLNGVLFIIVFFACRIAWGVYVVAAFGLDEWNLIFARWARLGDNASHEFIEPPVPVVLAALLPGNNSFRLPAELLLVHSNHQEGCGHLSPSKLSRRDVARGLGLSQLYHTVAALSGTLR